MQAFFDDIDAKFNADASLKNAGRNMYFGLRAERLKTAPFVDVTREGGETEDTFGIDLEVFDLAFTCVTKRGSRQNECSTLMAHVIRVFDDWEHSDSDLTIERFTRTGTTGPYLLGGVYEGTVLYEAEIKPAVLSSPRPNTGEE